MNYLCHLLLSGDDPAILAGNLAGDFIKGPLQENGGRVVQGVKLHRSIDSFAEKNHYFGRSRRRLSPDIGLYRGILVDLYYDHFLAIGWNQYSDESLPRYLARVRALIEQQQSHLPPRLCRLLPAIFEDFIPRYADPEGIALLLRRLGARIPRGNPLERGGEELLRHYQGLQEDFQGFLPQAREHAAEFLAALPPNGRLR